MSTMSEPVVRKFGKGTCPKCSRLIAGRALPDGTIELAAHMGNGHRGSCEGMRLVVPDLSEDAGMRARVLRGRLSAALLAASSSDWNVGEGTVIAALLDVAVDAVLKVISEPVSSGTDTSGEHDDCRDVGGCGPECPWCAYPVSSGTDTPKEG